MCAIHLFGSVLLLAAAAASAEELGSSVQCQAGEASLSKQDVLMQTAVASSTRKEQRGPTETEGVSGLTPFEQDYLTDANNPLDGFSGASGTGTDASETAASGTNASGGVGGGEASGPGTDAPGTAASGTNASGGVGGGSSYVDPWEEDLLTDTDTQEEDSIATHYSSGSTASSTSVTTTSTGCVTQVDARADFLGYETSPGGTTCVFGVDARDEGSHCILSDGQYGYFGWCFTSQDRSSWGSCSETCPLFGPILVVGEKIDRLERVVSHHIAWEHAQAEATTTTTEAEVITTTTEAEVITTTTEAAATATTTEAEVTTRTTRAASATTTKRSDVHRDSHKSG